MLSIAPLNNSAYYSELAAEDYYNNNKEPAGKWAGKGAAALGLSGNVKKAEFARIVSGHDLDGKALTQTAGKETYRAGQDLCFSVPKSVTLARRLASPELAAKIHQAELNAVSKALEFVESVAQTRTSPKDYQNIAGATFAIYEHSTARAADGQPPDPQDHYHCLMMAPALCTDGKTRAIDFRSIYQEKMTAGALFRAELASELRHLGFGIEKDGFSFKVAGIAPAMEKHFSKRGEQVKAATPENATAAQKSIAAKKSRTAKGELDRAGLSAFWKKEAAEKFGVNEKTIDGLRKGNMELGGRSNDSILRGLTKRKPYLNERDLRKAAAQDCILSGRDFKERLQSLKSSKGLTKANDKQMTYTPHPKVFTLRTSAPKTQLSGVKSAGDKQGQASAGGGAMASMGGGGTAFEKALSHEKDIELSIKALNPKDPNFGAKLAKLSVALQHAGEDVVKAQVAATKKLVKESGGLEM